MSRNQAAEAASANAFKNLQNRILQKYGMNTPSNPNLRLRNATQTSLVLEWDPIELATAELRSLSLYRNDSKAGAIPRPLEMLSTKISGLDIDTEYTFYLVLRTSAGVYASKKLKCRTHKMTDLSGITVTTGVMPPGMRQSLSETIERIGGKIVDTIRIDTTHFVCTEGRGQAWEKAVGMNIPVVRPEWVEACEQEGTIVSVRGYYLNADPKFRKPTAAAAQQNHQHQPSRQENKSPKPNDASATSSKSQSQSNLQSSEDQAKPSSGNTTAPSSSTSVTAAPPTDTAVAPPPLPPKGQSSGDARDTNGGESASEDDGAETATEGEGVHEKTAKSQGTAVVKTESGNGEASGDQTRVDSEATPKGKGEGAQEQAQAPETNGHSEGRNGRGKANEGSLEEVPL